MATPPVPIKLSSMRTHYNGGAENAILLSVKSTTLADNGAKFLQDLWVENKSIAQTERRGKSSNGRGNETCRLPICNAKIVGGNYQKFWIYMT